jgi:hypothetical protein
MTIVLNVVSHQRKYVYGGLKYKPSFLLYILVDNIKICTPNESKESVQRGGAGFKCLYRSPASRRSRRIGNPVPGGINWATLFLEDINTGTWPSRLRESPIWENKIWL